MFPAGVPQIAASALSRGTWAARVPCRPCSAPRVQPLTMGSPTTIPSQRIDGIGRQGRWFRQESASIKGQTIVLTANRPATTRSVVPRQVRLTKADVTIKSMGQAEIISAMSSNNADLGGLWAPHLHARGKAGPSDLLGKDAGPSCPAR